MSLTVTDLQMSESYDVCQITLGNGLIDLETTCNHQVVSNLVRARIQSEINWRLFVENTNIDDSVVAQQLRFVIDTTPGVVSSDFINFASTRSGRNINFSGICFTVDCDHSRECITL